MIQLPTTNELEVLQSYNQPNCLSIYVSHVAQNTSDNPSRIQLKNLLKEARQLLEAKKLDFRQINAILRPAKTLLDSEEFRAGGNHSLALFIQKDFFQLYHLPSEGIKSSVMLGDHFNLKPIIQLAEENPSYYVLALSHNRVQLMKGDQYYVEELQPKDFPTNMKKVLNIDEYPNETQTHSVAPASKGKGSEKFHGQYNETQVDKDMLVEFFRRIDRYLHNMIKDVKTPLILGGVDYLLPLYRQVSTHPNLLLGEIRGNLEHNSLDFIRERAYKLVDEAAV